MSLPRPQSPILLLGYGTEGILWLDAVRQSLRGDGLAERVPLGSLIQFWAVVEDLAECPLGDDSEIWLIESPTSEGSLRDRLDHGRTADLQRAFPTLGVESLLVLERWSPVHTPPDIREQFHRQMDRMRRVGFRPEGGREIHFTWVGIADGVRAAGPLSFTDAQSVERHFSQPMLTSFVLLIDRADQSGAVITELGADAASQAIAESLVFASASGVDLGADLISTDAHADDDPGTIRPISITRLRHGHEDLAAVQSQRLRRLITARRVAGGVVDADPRRRFMEAIAPGSPESPAQRDQAIVSALADGLARSTLRMAHPWRCLHEGVRQLEESCNRRALVSPESGGGAVPREERKGCFPDLVLLRGWLSPRHRLRPIGPSGGARVEAEPPSRHEREDWVQALGLAKHVADLWDAWLAMQRAPSKPLSPWCLQGGDYRLVCEADSDPAADRGVEGAAWRVLAEECLVLSAARQDLNTSLIDLAIDRAGFRIHSGENTMVEEFVLPALRPPNPDFSLFRWPPLSIHTGDKAARSDIIAWLHGLSGASTSLFQGLERPEHRPRVKALAVLSGHHTIRLELGEVARWTQVLSLTATPPMHE